MEFSKYRAELYRKWQGTILRILLIGACTALGVELVIFAVYLRFGMIAGSVPAYLLLRIAAPSSINFLAVLLARHAVKSPRRNRSARTNAVCCAALAVCASVATFHAYFQFFLVLYVLPFFLCTAFGSLRLLNRILCATVPAFAVSYVVMLHEGAEGAIPASITTICLVMLLVIFYVISMLLVKSQERQILYIFGAYREQVALTKKLRIEPLTQLYNKEALHDGIDAALRRFAAGGPAPVMVMIDIDHFKHVNDTYGHLDGDAVLVALATIIRRNMCSHAGAVGAFRFGGEEFVLLFEHVSCGQIHAAVQAIKDEFGARDFGFAPGVHFTLSAGIAGARPGWTGGTWLNAADGAMYRAKNAGRNRIVEFESDD